MIETMTLNELLCSFRGEGISCGYDTVVELIMQGKLPFAVGVVVNGRNKFLIFRKGYEEWISAKGKN